MTIALQKLARQFSLMLQAQQSNAPSASVQAGDIADGFPDLFPAGGAATSPLMTNLDAFLSKILPEDVNVSVKFLVQPGFRLNYEILFTKAGKPIQNQQWAAQIKQWLDAATKTFSRDAAAKFSGKAVTSVLEVATHNL